jgi:hypothetical protein
MRQEKSLRFSLAILFCICGVWLFAYSVQMLNFTSRPIPWYSSWAWFEPLRLPLSALAPVVYLGYREVGSLGTLGGVLCDWGGASFYLMTAAVLLMDEEVGVKLATVSCVGNVLVLSLQTGSGIFEPTAHRGRMGILAMFLMTTALVGYAVLTFILYQVSRSNRNLGN